MNYKHNSQRGHLLSIKPKLQSTSNESFLVKVDYILRVASGQGDSVSGESQGILFWVREFLNFESLGSQGKLTFLESLV